MEPKTKKWKTEKLKSKKWICSKVGLSVNSPGDQCSLSPEEEKEGYGGNDLQKRKGLSLEWKNEGLMDDESGELIEPMEEVPLKESDESELERLVRGWRRIPKQEW